MASTIDSVESTILARVIAPDQPMMDRAVAAELLKWRFSDQDQRLMSDLAAKAREGTLEPEETETIEAYERVASFLGLVKSKARLSMATRSDE